MKPVTLVKAFNLALAFLAYTSDLVFEIYFTISFYSYKVSATTALYIVRPIFTSTLTLHSRQLHIQS